MPPKNKRKLQIVDSLERARESKRSRKSGEGSSSSTVTEVRSERFGVDTEDVTLAQLIVMPEDALDTDDETVDPSFDLDSSMLIIQWKPSVKIGFVTLTGMTEFL